MPPLYPLRFDPIFRRYLWGGRRLGTVLGKAIGPGDDYAESWEIVDHGEDQSRVAAGPLAGVTLGELVRERGAELFGRHHPLEQFPLLFKFLDASKTLSVQVHPNDDQGARLDPPDGGKTEAWVILDVAPGSLIYSGLKRGFDRAALEREVSRGTSELCLHRFEPHVGDCVFLPAGTVHALGAGLLVAEIQQSSDTTYRLHDWNRVGPDGKPRDLHIEKALDVTDFDRGPVHPVSPQPTDRAGVSRLVACDQFVLDRWEYDGSNRQTDEFNSAGLAVGGDDRFHILVVLAGEVSILGDPSSRPLQRGQTLLAPASVGPIQITANSHFATMLDIYLP